jgi:hypothetical protein
LEVTQVMAQVQENGWNTFQYKHTSHQASSIEGNTYKQTGDSPQIILLSSRNELPCNWVLVSYSAEAEQGSLTPKLYIDSGNGFTEEEAIYLTTQVNSKNEYMICLPKKVNSLRLDPISSSKCKNPRNFQTSSCLDTDVETDKTYSFKSQKNIRNISKRNISNCKW